MPIKRLLTDVGGLFNKVSSFFSVMGVIRYERVESQSETLLERTNDRVEVLWQLRR